MTASLTEFATKGEARVARKLVKAALAEGLSVSVWEGEDWAIKRSTNARAIFDNMATTGSDTLRLRDAQGEYVGFFSLVYGNDPDGEDLLSNYSDNELCERLAKLAYRVKTTI